MSSPEEEWWRVVAAEYVLGTLRGEDLALFETVLQSDADARQEVIRWERHLAPLDQTTLPQKPPADLWPQIQQRIRSAASAADNSAIDTNDAGSREDLESTQPLDDSADVAKSIEVSIPVDLPVALPVPIELHVDHHPPERNLWWPAIAALATAASLLMGVLLSRNLQQSVVPGGFNSDGVSVVYDDQANALWLVQADFDTDRVRVTALAPPPIDNGNDYQLWQVLPNEGGVGSVGLLPETTGLSRDFQVSELASVFDAFAVSLEPVGGSPVSTPSGPVLFQGTFIHTHNDSGSSG
jgi:anti-sigma-K factor RskA